jgi:D-lactate dehydrogenase
MNEVFFYEAFAEEARSLRKRLPADIDAGYNEATIQEAGHASPRARMISIRTQSVIPPAWAPQLDAILSRSTGFDHMLAYAAQVKKPPALGYVPLYCQRAVAEQAALLWMALLRRLPQQMRQFTTFDRNGVTGAECQGKTLVVVGVGNIGGEVCRIGQGLGMRVLGVDLHPRYEDIEHAELDTALAQADIVVCAMDLNRSNRGFFNQSRLAKIKRGAMFVNIARGELSPSTTLLAALEAGQLAGVALDVFDHEVELAVSLRSGQPSKDAEARATLALAQHANVICTPHNAFNTAESLDRKSADSVKQVIAFRETGRFLWDVPRD